MAQSQRSLSSSIMMGRAHACWGFGVGQAAAQVCDPGRPSTERRPQILINFFFSWRSSDEVDRVNRETRNAERPFVSADLLPCCPAALDPSFSAGPRSASVLPQAESMSLISVSHPVRRFFRAPPLKRSTHGPVVSGSQNWGSRVGVPSSPRHTAALVTDLVGKKSTLAILPPLDRASNA